MANRPIRPYEVEARQKAFRVARELLTNDKLSMGEESKRAGVNRHAVGNAMLILQHGEPQEIADLERGAISPQHMGDAIRRRVPKEKLLEKSRGLVASSATKGIRDAEMEVWSKLKVALDGLTSLPSPKDTAAVVRRNNGRVEAVNRKLLAAVAWITEFENEITR